jgi:hypothetical protein
MINPTIFSNKIVTTSMMITFEINLGNYGNIIQDSVCVVFFVFN